MRYGRTPALACLAVTLAAPAEAHVIEVTGALGERIAVTDKVKVRPIAVIEDSRCPQQATCIWAGRVVVKAVVYARHRRTPVTLTLGAPLAIAGGRLTLDQVKPARGKGPIVPADYRFGLSFAGGS